MSDGFKQKLFNAWSTVVLLYTSSQRKGWKHVLLHFLICFLLCLALNLLLFLGLSALEVEFLVSGVIFAGSLLIVTGALFFSKNIRCFTLLFLISCGMKQGRNILLMAGTSLVACWSIHNTFQNLHKISQSILCNLQKKAEFLQTSPIENYLKMIRWFRDQLKMISEFAIIKFQVDMNIYHNLDSGALTTKLRNAEELVKNQVAEVEAMYHQVRSISQKLVPVLGVLLLIVSTTLFLRKFLLKKKYNNKFITSEFTEYDEKVKAEGKLSVLPLNQQEAQRYITIPSIQPRRAELFFMAMYFIPVSINIASWFYFMILDLLLYWITVVIKKSLLKLEPFHIPLNVRLQEKTEVLSISLDDKTRNANFPFSVSLFEDECLPEPTLVLTDSLLPLLSIVCTLLVLGLLSAKLLEFKLLVLEKFYTEAAEERVKHLHAKILRQRSKQNAKDLEKAWLQVVTKDVRFWFPILDFCG